MSIHNGASERNESFPPKNWEQMDEWLFNRCSELNDAPKFRFEKNVSGVEPEDIKDFLQRSDAAHADEVGRCIYELATVGKVPWTQYSPHCRELIELRLKAATTFVTTIGLASGTPISFPPDSSKFIEWLLTQWWREQGVIEIAYGS